MELQIFVGLLGLGDAELELGGCTEAQPSLLFARFRRVLYGGSFCECPMGILPSA